MKKINPHLKRKLYTVIYNMDQIGLYKCTKFQTISNKKKQLFRNILQNNLYFNRLILFIKLEILFLISWTQKSRLMISKSQKYKIRLSVSVGNLIVIANIVCAFLEVKNVALCVRV
jgi:hypothetical protein